MSTHTPMIDLGPAAEEVARIAAGVRPEHLSRPTPCDGTSVAAMIGHFLGLTEAFRAAADKDPVATGPPPSPPSGDEALRALPSDWHERLGRQLDALVAAWRDPDAWQGEATAGGVTMPAPVMGGVVLNELVLHGWDLAVSTGQQITCDPGHLEVVLASTRAAAEEAPQGTPGLFGPPVPVPEDADPFDHALGYAGRDPSWSPPAREA